MQLTSFTGYGLHALIFPVTLLKPNTASISTSTKIYGISYYCMAEIINKLSHINYINMRRGNSGGIRRDKPAQEIVIDQVVRNNKVFTAGWKPCPVTHDCRLKEVLHSAANCFPEEWDHYTLATFVTNNEPHHQTLLLASSPLDS